MIPHQIFRTKASMCMSSADITTPQVPLPLNTQLNHRNLSTIKEVRTKTLPRAVPSAERVENALIVDGFVNYSLKIT